MVFNPTYDNDISDCTSTDYKIEVTRGKGTTEPGGQHLEPDVFRAAEGREVEKPLNPQPASPTQCGCPSELGEKGRKTKTRPRSW